MWANTSLFQSVEQSKTADRMSCKTTNNLPVELVCASSFALDVFGSALFSIKEIYIVSTSRNPKIW